MNASDKTIWTAYDPDNTDAYGFRSEAEAYEHWQDYGDTLQYVALNPVEGWSRSLNNEFEDWAADEACHARGWQKHVDSYQVPA